MKLYNTKQASLHECSKLLENRFYDFFGFRNDHLAYANHGNMTGNISFLIDIKNMQQKHMDIILTKVNN